MGVSPASFTGPSVHSRSEKSKMRYDIVTIFPHIFDSYFNESILGRAQENGLIEVRTHDIRDAATDRHKTADDRPYGGGAGMVLTAEPILKTFEKALKATKKIPRNKRKILLLSAKGKQFNQRMTYQWAKKYEQIILIAGRYEGIDERVKTILKAEEISIGPYVLTDGDVAAMVIISAVTRLLPGVIKWESLKEESHFNLLAKKGAVAGNAGLEYPHYTRPEILEWNGKKYRVPKVLLSGDHKKIAAWRSQRRK